MLPPQPSLAPHGSAALTRAPRAQAILMNKEDTTRVRLVFANTQEHDILLRCAFRVLHGGRAVTCKHSAPGACTTLRTSKTCMILMSRCLRPLRQPVRLHGPPVH